MSSRKKVAAYIAGFAISMSIFVIANWLQPPAMCADCFAPHGAPFTYFHEGGFAGGAAWVWSGIVADAALVLAAGLFVGFSFNRFASRKF